MAPQEDGALYGFLYSFGLKEALETALQKCEGASVYHKCCTLFALLEDIAVKHGADTDSIRSFFVKYGPVGGACYTRRLVMNSEIFIPYDFSGRKLLDEIKAFVVPEQKDIATMIEAYKPLAEKVNRMQTIVVDNPFCIAAGIYDKQSGVVLCKNLKGIFGFYIHGQLMPLGFEALIRDSKKGE